MIKGSIKVGSATIQVEAETQVGLVKAAGFWGECPSKCGNCKSSNIGFFSRSPSGNLYVGVKCGDCKYEMNFGQNKEGGHLFIKHDEGWKAPWAPDGNQTSNYGDDTQGNSPVDDDDDIPF